MPAIAKLISSFFCFIVLLFVQPALAETVTHGVFKDAERNRTIPYKLYAPAPSPRPAPVVIFSHGLGGSTDAAPYLGEALSEAGYYAFFIQHPGSDKSLWEGTRNPLKIKQQLKGGMNYRAATDRYADIPFVIEELARLNADGSLKGRLDLARIGMAGHSFGARGVLMAAGENPPVGPSFKDARIKAAIPLSPNVPERYIKNQQADFSTLYADIDIPLFHITGTEDGHPFQQDFDPEQRTVPYQKIAAPDQYLLVLDGATHATFGGGRRASGSDDPAFQQIVARGAVLFFDAYLKGDRHAKQALQNDFPKTLSPGDRFTHK